MKCTECNGTGRYVGLLKEEACKVCGGTGSAKPSDSIRLKDFRLKFDTPPVTPAVQFTTISFALDPELVLYEKPGPVHKVNERELDTTTMHSAPFRTKPQRLLHTQPTTMRTQVYVEPKYWSKLSNLINTTTTVTITFPGGIPNNYLTFQGFVNSIELSKGRSVTNLHDGLAEALTIEVGSNKLSVFSVDLGICLCPPVDFWQGTFPGVAFVPKPDSK